MFYQIPVSGTGNSGIVLVNYRQQSFSVTARVVVPATETATYSVYESLDDPEAAVIPTSISRTTTTATVVSTNHGLTANDWVLIRNAGAPLDGVFIVASAADKDTFTYTVANSGAATGSAFATYAPLRCIVPSALSAKSATVENTWVSPIRVLIMNISAHGAGTGQLTFEVLQGGASL